MWQCVKCREAIEDSFDACWRCGTSKDGVADPAFKGPQTGEFAAGKPAPAFAPTLSSATAAGERPKRLVASALVWVLRGLAFLAVIWGLFSISDALEASRNAQNGLRQLQEFQGDDALRAKAEHAAKSVARAASTAVFSSVVFAAALVGILLALSEGLRLCIAIEGNTRDVATLQ